MWVQGKEHSESIEAPRASHAQEFLVVSNDVCNDPTSFESIAAAVRLVNGRLNCAPNTASARDYIVRRKVDGIVVDMRLSGSLELIHRVRNGSSNRGSVVFAFMNPGPEAQMAMRAGANFILHRPLVTEKVVHLFKVAAEMMVSDKRRYFRFPLMVPVELNMKGRKVESTMSNLSEGGMAIWSLYYHIPGSSIDFAFEIPFGGIIRGRGEIAWTNADGLAGTKFRILPDQAYTYLSEWIARRDSVNAT